MLASMMSQSDEVRAETENSHTWENPLVGRETLGASCGTECGESCSVRRTFSFLGHEG